VFGFLERCEPTTVTKPRHTSDRPRRADADANAATPTPTALRIIGGTHRGRKLLYSGDARTRPMKDRVREAVFNLLGPDVKGKHVLDLFAGTGALGFEALSRGAEKATFFEHHFPTADIIRQNAATIEVTARCQIVPGNTLIQFRRAEPVSSADGLPWLVFCSPPFDFYVDRQPEMLQLLTRIEQLAPPRSVIVVEADERFNFALLGNLNDWDIREYSPAVVGLRWLPEA
jgi:16S rRNA (guanine966-N2)-methyltransferase